MPINFTSIPWISKIAIAEKMKLVDFIMFEEGSKESKTVADNRKMAITVPNKKRTAFPYRAPRIRIPSHRTWGKRSPDVTIDVDSNGELILYFNKNLVSLSQLSELRLRLKTTYIKIKTYICNKKLSKLNEFLLRTNSRFFSITFVGAVVCSAEMFHVFLESSGAKSIRYNDNWHWQEANPIPAEHFRCSVMKTMQGIKAVTKQLTDEDLLSIKVPNIRIIGNNFITNKTINRILKEFLNGTRIIHKIAIELCEESDEDAIFDGISYEYLSYAKFLISSGNKKKLVRFNYDKVYIGEPTI